MEEKVKVLATVLGQDLFDLIPEASMLMLSEKWDILIKEKIDLEKDKINSEQRFIELEHHTSSVQQQLEEINSQHECSMLKNEQLRLELEKCSMNLDKSERIVLLSERGNATLKRDYDYLILERNSMDEKLKRRELEIEQLTGELNELSKRFSVADEARCLANIALDEYKSNEENIKLRNSDWYQERQQYKKQISKLTDDLNYANDKLISFSNDELNRQMNLQSLLAEKVENVEALELKVKVLEEEINERRAQAEGLSERLRLARETELKLSHDFRVEIKAQTKLAEIHREHFESSDIQVTELKKVIEVLQDETRELSAKLKESEQNSHNASIAISQGEESVLSLQREIDVLSQSNGKKQIMSNKTFISLDTSGMTSKAYAQFVSLGEALDEARNENRRLNIYLEQILKEIEERAPIIRKQREEFKIAMITIADLKEKLRLVDENAKNSVHDYEEIKRCLKIKTRESSHLKLQVKDLGIQIAALLREIEAARSGIDNSTPSNAEDKEDDLDGSGNEAGDIIDKNLVSFRSISEMQEQNIRLLRVVRDLSEKKELIESEVIEERTQGLRNEIECMSLQLDELRAARTSNKTMMDSLVLERDMFRSMYDAKNKDERLKIGEDKLLAGTKKELQDLKQEFEAYRREKSLSEATASENLAKLRNSCLEAKSRADRANVEREICEERLKIAAASLESFKKQLAAVEENNRQLKLINAKLESSMVVLNKEVMDVTSKFASVEVRAQMLEQEKTLAKGIEARLVAEREVCYREGQVSKDITENLKQIQIQLERKTDREISLLRNKNEELLIQIDVLNKKLEEEQINFRTRLTTWEYNEESFRVKLNEATEDLKRLEDENNHLEAKYTANCEALKGVIEKITVLKENTGDSSSGHDSSDQFLLIGGTSEKEKELQILLADAKNENIHISEQLTTSREAISRYQEMAVETESKLNDVKREKEKLEQDILQYQKDKEEKLIEISLIQEKFQLFEEKHINLRSEPVVSDAKLSELEIQLREKDSLVGSMQTELDACTQRLNHVNDELETEHKVSEDMRFRYERELKLHAEDIVRYNEVKVLVEEKQKLIDHLEKLKVELENNVETAKMDLLKYRGQNDHEMEIIREQYELSDKNNALLLSQLSMTSKKLASLTDPSIMNDDDRADFKAVENLNEIINYLRKEKEVLVVKLEVNNAELIRLESQLSHCQTQLEDVRQELKLERGKSFTASKRQHMELMKKVENYSVLSDVNKMLSEERDKLRDEAEISSMRMSELVSKDKLKSEQINRLEEEKDLIMTEKQVLKEDVTMWMQRVDQLIEKSQKVSPEEMKKLQNDNNSLTQQITQLQSNLKTQTSLVQTGAKKMQILELERKNKDATIASLTHETQNAKKTSALSTKKIEDLEVDLKAYSEEKDKLGRDLNNLKATQEALSKKYLSDVAAAKDEVNSLTIKLQTTETDFAKVKSDLVQKESSFDEIKIQANKLKQVARQFKEKAENLEKEVALSKEQNTDLQTQLEAATSKAASENSNQVDASGIQERLNNADQLLEASSARILELEENIENLGGMEERINELLQENLELKDQSVKKNERARSVLRTAKSKITLLTEENIALRSQLQANQRNRETPQVDSELNKKISELENKNQTMLDELRSEKDKVAILESELQEKIGLLEDQSTVNVSNDKSASIKPMAIASASVSQRLISVQPQAHIAPTRHHTQTASIKPMAIRTTARPSQPTIASVSPSTSISTILNVMAVDFVPRTMDAANQESSHEGSDVTPPPRALVLPCLQLPILDQQPGTSATASVAPTTKRLRETHSEGCISDLGVAKKSRIQFEEPVVGASSTTREEEDDNFVLSSDAADDVISDVVVSGEDNMDDINQEEEVIDEEEIDDGEEEEEENDVENELEDVEEDGDNAEDLIEGDVADGENQDPDEDEEERRLQMPGQSDDTAASAVAGKRGYFSFASQPTSSSTPSCIPSFRSLALTTSTISSAAVSFSEALSESSREQILPGFHGIGRRVIDSADTRNVFQDDAESVTPAFIGGEVSSSSGLATQDSNSATAVIDVNNPASTSNTTGPSTSLQQDSREEEARPTAEAIVSSPLMIARPSIPVIDPTICVQASDGDEVDSDFCVVKVAKVNEAQATGSGSSEADISQFQTPVGSSDADLGQTTTEAVTSSGRVNQAGTISTATTEPSSAGSGNRQQRTRIIWNSDSQPGPSLSSISSGIETIRSGRGTRGGRSSVARRASFWRGRNK